MRHREQVLCVGMVCVSRACLSVGVWTRSVLGVGRMLTCGMISEYGVSHLSIPSENGVRLPTWRGN